MASEVTSKREQLIKSIGEKLIDELFKLDNEYKYEADEYGFYSASYGVSIYYEYGNSGCDIECYVSWESRHTASIECLVYGGEGVHENRFHKLDCIEKAIQGYVEKNLDTEELIEVIEDDIREANMDEWECHGFRDAADYYHYRYG